MSGDHAEARAVIGLAPVAALVSLAALAACAPPVDESASPERLSVGAALATGDTGEDAGFARALEPRELEFPADQGPHPDFKTEWWYWIGNLATSEGRRVGYQLTFFRSALTAPPDFAEGSGSEKPVSLWSTRQLYMAHLAVSDIDGSLEGPEFQSSERFSRGAVGLAGAQAEPFRVWLEDWSVEATGASQDRWRLRARDGALSIELILEPGKPLVLHGERGLSRKGDRPGAASYYYSGTRMPTKGRIELGSTSIEVSGESWFDREWSTSLLADDEVGWDWLGAQLEDGRELMFFRLRRPDGSSARVDGTLVGAAGESRALRTGGHELVALGTWTSPETGVSYPAGFRLVLPEEGLELEIQPLLADQELRHSFVYWEGAVEVSGSATGRGYLEMTGYGKGSSPR